MRSRVSELELDLEAAHPAASIHRAARDPELRGDRDIVTAIEDEVSDLHTLAQ